jgi:hypothetical protein
MRNFALIVRKFVAALVICAIASTLIWELFVAGTIYRCNDPGFLQFLSPGDWAHTRFGDTFCAGWSTTGLWWLWFSLVIVSVVVSLAFALLPRAFRSSHG